MTSVGGIASRRHKRRALRRLQRRCSAFSGVQRRVSPGSGRICYVFVRLPPTRFTGVLASARYIQQEMVTVQRVLVVDDDAALLRLLRLSLQDSGFEVSTATNGAEALDRLGAATPSAVVLDLEMPIMDGRTFYHEMRARGIEAPVLILSAYDARRAQRELNAEAWMDKPFDPGELSAALCELVGAERRRGR